MKTVGTFLREARLRRRKSREDVEKETKIKREFVRAIEEEDWVALPDYPTVSGFVKTLAKYFEKEEGQASALLRRDYPPKVLSINPKPDVSKKFVWEPKTSFFVGIVSVVLVVAGYLGFQYFQFVSPPDLVVEQPEEGVLVEDLVVEVAGKTDPDATIRVNNQPVIVDAVGNFFITLEISETTNEIEIKALSRSGKEASIRRNIIVEAN